MKNIPPNIDALSFTGSAVIIGFLLIDDLTINEQNAIGDWLMLVGQVLQTNASQKQVIEERLPNKDDFYQSKDIDIIKKGLNLLNKEIENIKAKKN